MSSGGGRPENGKDRCGGMIVEAMKRAFARSVSFKVLSILAVTVLVAIFSSLVVMNVMMRERLLDDLRSRTEESARLLASMLAGPLARSSAKDVEELVRAYAERQEMVAVAVLAPSPDGEAGAEERVVAGFVREGEHLRSFGSLPEEERLGGGEKLLRVAEPVPASGGTERIGTVEVHVSYEKLYREAHRHLVIHGMAAILFVCVLMGVLFLGLERVVFDPLRRLSEAVNRFHREAGSGELDERTPLPPLAPVVRSTDEFGDLAATFRELSGTLQSSFSQRDRLLRELRQKNNLLVLEAATRDKALREVDATQRELVLTLGEVVETRSADTANHVRRVGEYAWLLARGMGLGAEAADLLRVASPLHDVGKIGIPDMVLNKPGPLTPEEFDLVKTHTLIGNRLLGSSPRRIFKVAADVALQHHERWDGKGYPEGRRGEEIDLFARITCVADVFDALTHRRVYKSAWPLEETLAFLRREEGGHFDPQVVTCFFSSLEEILSVFRTYPDD